MSDTLSLREGFIEDPHLVEFEEPVPTVADLDERSRGKAEAVRRLIRSADHRELTSARSKFCKLTAYMDATRMMDLAHVLVEMIDDEMGRRWLLAQDSDR